MSVTLSCRKTEHRLDLSMSGFLRFRMKVAELCDPCWYALYRTLPQAFSMLYTERSVFYTNFNKEVDKLLDSGKVRRKLVGFCMQSDCGGVAHYGACKKFLQWMGDYSDTTHNYGFGSNFVSFNDLKDLLHECVDNRCDLVWY